MSDERPAQSAARDPSFEDVLDETCGRLWDTKVRHSLKRIDELETSLARLENELDALLKASGQ
ncbi:MAG: hypothetical protein LBD08_04810 [Treponema sp.]|jgi:hypothetical protein|nr:hypothetical protein [Treponema sp.]